MQQRAINKMTVMVLSGLCVFGLLDTMAAEISQVLVRQRWPWSRMVDIDYTLSCDPTEELEIMVTAYNGTERLMLPLSSFSGDLHGVSDGAHRIVWDPMATTYTNNGSLTSFSVELTATAPPLYMIVDLTKDAGADGQIEYVYETDLHAGVWGACATNPVSNNGTPIQSLVWTGVTNVPAYKTDQMVLRRIPAGSYTMGGDGYSERAVNLTQDIYAGVFEVTDAQWGRIMGSGTTSKPKIKVSYNDIRGATTDEPSIDWPNTDRAIVAPDSFMSQLRSKTGISDFDLPTEAQWEYLCRAGTTTVFNDGNVAAEYSGTIVDNNGTTNKYLDVLGWHKGNSTAVQTVGQKAVNAWGLYDTHGNVSEWCLDWIGTTASGDDPPGPLTGSHRIMRGGCWAYDASKCRSTVRGAPPPTGRGNDLGFRLVRTLP